MEHRYCFSNLNGGVKRYKIVRRQANHEWFLKGIQSGIKIQLPEIVEDSAQCSGITTELNGQKLASVAHGSEHMEMA